MATKKSLKKKVNADKKTLENKKGNHTGLMKTLMLADYKGGKILVRRLGEEVFIWDVFFKDNFYSSYIIMKPAKGTKELNANQVTEVSNMCYAGAASSIDLLLNTKMSKEDKEKVEAFESGRKGAEKMIDDEKEVEKEDRIIAVIPK